MRVNQALLLPSYCGFGVLANWTFTWPYATDGSCRCVESSVGLFHFNTESDCVAAFIDSPYETCSAAEGGLAMAQCEDAVSTKEGYSNAHCSGLCAETLANPEKAEKFERECYFEFTIAFKDSIAAPSTSCFTNYVFGHSDYNPDDPEAEVPLNWFSDVPSAAKCQELCQNTDQCALWTWRGTKDSDGSSRFQNPPLTCIIYSERYVEKVLSVVVEDELVKDRRYCDFERITECSSDQFDRTSINPLDPHACLMCDCTPRCIFLSPAHVSGPVYCAEAQITEYDLCHLHRPSWTTTEPPCVVENEPQLGWFSKNPLSWRGGSNWLNEGESTELGGVSTTTVVIDDTVTSIELDTTTGVSLDTKEYGGLMDQVIKWFEK